jgi:hypothetical protein
MLARCLLLRQDVRFMQVWKTVDILLCLKNIAMERQRIASCKLPLATSLVAHLDHEGLRELSANECNHLCFVFIPGKCPDVWVR